MHIHNVFASNELVSVATLLLYTDSPFRLSLLIFLSREKRTFSQTIMTLSVSILRVPFSFFCTAYFSFHFTYSKCIQIKFHSLPYSPVHVVAFPEQSTVTVTFHGITHEECCWNFSKCFWQQWGFQMTINFHVTSIHYPSRNQNYFHLKQALQIKCISK